MKTLWHNGVCFPERQKDLGLVLKINGIDHTLTLEQQEMIMSWAKKKGTPYWDDQVFKENFYSDFCKNLGIDYTEDIDLNNVLKIIEEDKLKKENMSKEEKKKLSEERKRLREERKAKYGYATVDGMKVELSNYMVEPAGIMMGRKLNPLRGRWKRSINPEDIVLNLSPDAPNVEELKSQGYKIEWHPDQMWIAKWEDPLYPNEYKYIWLSDTYSKKQEKERLKFDKALKLESKIEELNNLINEALLDNDDKRRKIATVVWLIKQTNMRVGDEHEADEANTVGATTLRKEHMKIEGNKLFLVRWEKELLLPNEVKSNLIEFLQKSKSEVFDGINSNHVSKFLSEILEGCTAKVFRTYAACKTFRTFLESNKVSKDEKEYKKKIIFQRANLEVAKALNHKKALPKNFPEQLKRFEERIQRAKDAKKPNIEKIEKMTIEFELKKDISEYNLNTSRNSYIDPRITYEFSSKMDYPIEKFYNKNQLRRFSWAFQ